MKASNKRRSASKMESLYELIGIRYIKKAKDYFMPTFWLRAYIYYLVPASIIISPILLIFSWADYDTIYNIGSIALTILTIPAYIYLKRLTKLGYYLNIILCACVVLFDILYKIYTHTISYYKNAEYMMTTILIVVLVVMHLAYFYIRRRLFSKTENIEK